MKMDIDSVVESFISEPTEYSVSSVLVGEDPDLGVSVYVEGVEDGENLYPEVSVWVDDDAVYTKTARSKQEFEEILSDVKFDYLSGFSKLCGVLSSASDEEPDYDAEDEIRKREDELDAAVYDFLKAVYKCNPFADDPDEESVLGEVKDALLGVLADFDPDIYRPLDTDDGYVEFPYSPL